MKTGDRGYIATDGWAGRGRWPVEIVSETPKRFRVRVEGEGWFPGRRYVRPGDVILVPKGHVRPLPVTA